MEKEKYPRIRFKGFTDAWEQRKLSELVLIERGGSPRPIDDYITDAPDGLNWVKIGDAPTQGHYITKTAEKIKPEGLSKTRQVQPGDLILSNSMSFGKPYIMAINGCIHDGWLLIRDTNNIFDLTFLCHLLGTTQMLGQYKQFAAGSTVNNLNKELVGNTIVTIPSKPEQKVLGEYFESMDSLITLHQRKCDSLKKIKHGLLEKMFPANNLNYPQIRFKGFTDAWEQRKYADIGSNSSGGNLSYDSLADNGKFKCVLYGDLYTLYDCTISSIERKTNFRGNSIKYNDILFPQSTTVDAYSLISPACLNEKNAETSGVFVISPNFDIDGNFIAYYTKGNEKQRIKLSKKAQGLTIVHLYYQSIKDETIFVPSFNEQKKISKLLISFDKLITLHQRKCEKLKNIKTSLLEKMFV